MQYASLVYLTYLIWNMLVTNLALTCHPLCGPQTLESATVQYLENAEPITEFDNVQRYL